MTFCVGIKVREGIVALADTQIVRGSERVSKQKLAALDMEQQPLFAMTSGLRSVRDKTLTYLDEALESQAVPCDRVFRIVNMFGEQLRRVRAEDGVALANSNLSFNTHAIIGGCLAGDREPQLFYVYPEGNWVEAATDSPYFIAGRTTYGKPILDRLLTYETSIRQAMALALLAFDATRMSVTDVDCPIDMAVIPSDVRQVTFHRYSQNEISLVTQWWDQTLSEALAAMPMDWTSSLLPRTTISS